jgi:hypothetical protein
MKIRKFLPTLIALVALAATWGAFTYYDKHKGSEKPAAETTNQEKIFSLDAQHIQSITFKPRDGDAFSCRREGGKWTITDPRHLDVDQGNFSGILNSLTTAAIDQVADPNPASLKDFGLDPPSFTLEITTDAKPQSFTLLLGDDTPTSGGLYAQVSGSPRVFTLSSYLKSSLEKKMFDLRDRRALTLEAEQLQKIAVEYKGTHWTLEKNPEGIWDLVLPPSVRADRFTVDGLVSQLRGLTMQTIAAEDKKKNGDYGLGSPELHLELTDLREKDLFSFSAFDVKRAELDTPKGHWVFQRQGNQWKQTAPKSRNVNSDKMDTLLTHLRDLRADSFPKGGNLADFGLAKPAYRFSIQYGDKNATEIVEAGKSGDHVYARKTTDPLPSELPKTALDDVEKSLGEL